MIKIVSSKVAAVEAASKMQATNRVAIFDRSGSMMWTIDKVVDDLYHWVEQIPNGDTVTIGWFSGPGQYRFILKGVRINGPEDLAMVKQVLDANRNVVATTCFSEILGDLASVVTDLSPISGRFSLVFLTDGCPVVPDVVQEIKDIEANLAKVELASALFIGYGDYYNRNLMADMARWSGGALIHADAISRFGVEINSFTKADKAAPAVEINAMGTTVFTVSDNGQPIIHKVQQNGKAKVLVGSKVYHLTIDGGSAFDDADLDGIYAACILLVRANRVELALETLGDIGDKHLVNKLANAYTVSELGNVESDLATAAKNKETRFVGGRKLGCLPDRNAFCVLQALQILASDDEAHFHPYHELFAYKRIGVKALVAEGYSTFTSKHTGCPLGTLVFHETRMNVSISTKISGTIELTDECANYGLGKKFPTYQHRNYTIVKDGALNVDCLPCSMSEATFTALTEHGVVSGTWVKDAIYGINLAALPVINRAMADNHKSAKQLCEWISEIYLLEGRLKAFRHYLKQCDPDGKYQHAESVLLPEAVEYLESQGVGKNGYSPKRTLEKPVDTYLAREFVVAAKGMSSLPKIDDVLDRRAKGKPQTKSGLVVLSGIEHFEAMAAESAKRHHHLTDDKQLIKALKQLIADEGSKLWGLRYKVQIAKFAVLLGNQWFDEFTSREDCRLTLGDYEFTFQIKESIQEC